MEIHKTFTVKLTNKEKEDILYKLTKDACYSINASNLMGATAYINMLLTEAYNKGYEEVKKDAENSTGLRV